MSAPAIFLKLAGWLFKPVRAFAGWAVSDIRHAMIALLLFSVAWERWKTLPALRAEIATLTGQRDAARGTVSNLQEAARQAAIRQQTNLVRVDAAHQAINRENVSALHAEIDGLRRRAELLSVKLRQGPAAADPGSADATGVPGSVPARAGAAEAAGDQGFPRAAGNVCRIAPGAMTIEQALIASEQAHQLDKLIDAAIAASEVRTSPEPQP